jgi:hypothetical protein
LLRSATGACWASRRTIGVSVSILAALWIMYGHAQNGRYAFHGEAVYDHLLDVVDRQTVVLDTRDGTVYTLVETTRHDYWNEQRPQTGEFWTHEVRQGRRKPGTEKE